MAQFRFPNYVSLFQLAENIKGQRLKRGREQEIWKQQDEDRARNLEIQEEDRSRQIELRGREDDLWPGEKRKAELGVQSAEQKADLGTMQYEDAKANFQQTVDLARQEQRLRRMEITSKEQLLQVEGAERNQKAYQAAAKYFALGNNKQAETMLKQSGLLSDVGFVAQEGANMTVCDQVNGEPVEIVITPEATLGVAGLDSKKKTDDFKDMTKDIYTFGEKYLAESDKAKELGIDENDKALKEVNVKGRFMKLLNAKRAQYPDHADMIDKIIGDMGLEELLGVKKEDAKPEDSLFRIRGVESKGGEAFTRNRGGMPPMSMFDMNPQQ
jgi:hypothetical protein